MAGLRGRDEWRARVPIIAGRGAFDQGAERRANAGVHARVRTIARARQCTNMAAFSDYFASLTADVRSCRVPSRSPGRVNRRSPGFRPPRRQRAGPSRNLIEIIRLCARRRLAARLRRSSVRPRRALRQPARRLPLRDSEPPQAHRARQPELCFPGRTDARIPATRPRDHFRHVVRSYVERGVQWFGSARVDRTAGAARKPHRPRRRATRRPPSSWAFTSSPLKWAACCTRPNCRSPRSTRR